MVSTRLVVLLSSANVNQLPKLQTKNRYPGGFSYSISAEGSIGIVPDVHYYEHTRLSSLPLRGLPPRGEFLIFPTRANSPFGGSTGEAGEGGELKKNLCKMQRFFPVAPNDIVEREFVIGGAEVI